MNSFSRFSGIAFSVLVFASISAMAGNTIGNGGDVVVCFSNLQARDAARTILERNKHSSDKVNPFEDSQIRTAVSSVQILDLYEYLLPTGFPAKTHQLITLNEPFTDYLPKAIGVLKQSSELGAFLEDALTTIPFSNWHASTGVVEIDDSNQAITLPNSCLLVQMAVRQDQHIYYDSILFSFLDEVQRTGLVFHELLYMIALEQKRESRQARLVTGLLLSYDEVLTPEQFHLRILPLVTAAYPEMIEGQKFWIREVLERWSPSGAKRRVFVKPQTFNVGGFQARVETELELSESQKITQFTGAIADDQGTEFKAQVSIDLGVVRGISFIQHEPTFSVQGFVCQRCKSLAFDSSGQLSGFSSSWHELIGPSSVVAVSGAAEFFPGTLIARSVSEGRILYWNTKYHTFSRMADCDVLFYPDGNIASGCIETIDPIQLKVSPVWTLKMDNKFGEECIASLQLDIQGNAISLGTDKCRKSSLEQDSTKRTLDSVLGIRFKSGTGEMEVARVSRFATLKDPNGEAKFDQGDFVFNEAGEIISTPAKL